MGAEAILDTGAGLFLPEIGAPIFLESPLNILESRLKDGLDIQYSKLFINRLNL
jgi:hypothetical protein